MTRTQLNLRLDGREELIERAKKHARTLGITLTEFVVDAIEQALQKNQPNQDATPNKATYALKEDIHHLRLSFMHELRKRDEAIASLAHAITQIQSTLDDEDEEPDATKSSQDRKSNFKEWEEYCEPGLGAWESAASQFLNEVEW